MGSWVDGWVNLRGREEDLPVLNVAKERVT